MARLFTSGVETGDLLDFNDATGCAISSGTVHTGTYSIVIANGLYSAKVFVSPNPSDKIYVRYWVYPGSAVPNQRFLEVRCASSYVRVVADASSRPQLQRATTPLATADDAVFPGQWYLFELYAYIHDSSGELTLKIDGNQVVTFSGDTKSSSYSAIEQVWFASCHKNIGLDNGYSDDFAINDTDGSEDNSWCGDGRVIAIKPDSAGDNTDFTPSAGSNYQNVDEAPPDDDTTYNESSTDGHYDLFNLEACGLSDVDILRIIVKATAKKTVANGDHMRMKIKTGGTEYDGDDLDLGADYTRLVQAWAENPDTSSAWTASDLDSLQAGYENRAA